MATSVTYQHSFTYPIDSHSGKSFPGLEFRVTLPGQSNPGVDVKVYLDTGAELSLFDGALIVPFLEIELMAGRERTLDSIGGFILSARIHRLELTHPSLGNFTLDAAISTTPIRRNLLGRDFFQHIQLGLREYHQSFFIAPTP